MTGDNEAMREKIIMIGCGMNEESECPVEIAIVFAEGDDVDEDKIKKLLCDMWNLL